MQDGPVRTGQNIQPASAAGSDRSRHGQVIACFAIALQVATTLGMRFLPELYRGALFDPDSYMRLVRLLDELRLGHTLHVVQRDDGGAGTLLHWSHLLDSVVWL